MLWAVYTQQLDPLQGKIFWSSVWSTLLAGLPVIVLFWCLVPLRWLAPKAGLAAQPLFFLLKDDLRLGAAETATFIALTGLAWNVKPLYGLLSDLVPLAGSRRRSYLLVTTAAAALGWLALGLLPVHAYGPLLVLLSVTGLGLARLCI